MRGLVYEKHPGEAKPKQVQGSEVTGVGAGG